ncbi:MAG TPA: pitrilysin family protein [Blastocatellia bacterium]|nr:pitrilysin family protein [Blastocatellia bacterium]
MARLTLTGDLVGMGTGQHSFMTRSVEKTVLSNGLTIITKEMHDRPVVATVVWYKVGSKNEELGQTGKSHFLEHMMFKGTDRYKRGDIDLITLKNGGANNAFTWLDFTAYYFTFASDRWSETLEIESNRMRNTTFAEDEFQSEKKVVQEELYIGLDGPWEALENEVWATAFRQHPYHWPTVGWLEDLENATAADMKAYYDKWYHPRNATLVIAGDFETAPTLALIDRLFGPIPAGPEAKLLHIVEPPQHGAKRVMVKRPTPIERLLIAYHVPAVADPDTYPLHVLEALLSTGKTSRLYRRLVDRDESVTLARASCEDHIDPSLFSIQAEIKPGFRLQDVEQAVYEEIDKLSQTPVAESDLEKAKNQIEADLVFSHEEPLQQAILLGQYETIASADRVPADSRGYKYLGTLLDRIRAVTTEDVRRVAATYFREDNRTVGYFVNESGQGEQRHRSGEMAEDDPDGELGHGSQPDGTTEAGIRFRSDAAPDTGTATSHPDRVGPARVLGYGTGGRAFGRGRCYRTGAQNGLESRHGRLRIPEPETGTTEDRATSGQGGSGAPRNQRHTTLDVERLVLPNGMMLLLSEEHSVPAISIRAIVNAGSRFEPDDKAGLASLVGELLDEGTRSQSSDQIAEAVEAAGGRLDAFGEYQYSGVQGTFLSKDLSLALDITADLLINAAFPDDKVKNQTGRRMAQIKSRLDVPHVLASDTFNEIVFRGFPGHRPPIGYAETVGRLSRQNIVDFHRQYYVPNNTMLAIVGDISKAEVKQRVEDIFGTWLPEKAFELPAVPRPARQTKAIEQFVTAPKEQINIFMGHLGIDRMNPDYYSLLVLDTILGSSPGFTSRIPRILRDEEGLAYSTFSNIAGSARLDPGRFVAYIGTSPQNLDRALTGMRREITRIVREPVTLDELEGAKDYLTGSFVFDFQTNAQIAQFLIDAEVYHLGFDYLSDYPALITAVTVGDVSRVAKKYIDPAVMTTVVVGPLDERGK